jgi:hypothetical protein
MHRAELARQDVISHSTSRFYVGIALLFLVLLVAGFAPTFFFRGMTDAEPLPPATKFHGIMLTAWFVLFVVQATLARQRRLGLHRTLGVIAAIIAASATTGFVWLAVSLYYGRAPEVEAALVERARFVRIVRELTVFAAFPALVGLAVWWRRNADVHKRLVVLATIALLPPALSRLAFWPGQLWPELAGVSRIGVALGGSVALLVLVCIHDIATRGRVHIAYAWGGPIWFTWLVGSGLVVPKILF